jgi:hypothetical protein
MKSQKGGLIYAPAGELWWAKSHAMISTADVVDGQTIRVYFASLDQHRYGRVGYVELDADNLKRILFETKEPVLDIGDIGTFDDCGVNPSCVLTVGDKKYLYYIGWQRAERVPYMLFTSLAVSEDNGITFKKIGRVPVMDRTEDDSFSRYSGGLCGRPAVGDQGGRHIQDVVFYPF